MRQLKTLLKRILVIAMLFITLMFFVLRPPVEAGKLPKDGEFYYTGKTEGTYVVTEGIFAWLLDALKGIADFILGAISMAFRMPIVGWTALAEKLLTSTLEATMGTKLNVDEINATDISESTDSSDNVTVEAIVYNLVPFFNINLFENSTEHLMRSGTGRDLSAYVCETCENPIDTCTCDESKCNCNLCQIRRFRSDPNNKTVVDMVKENVAGWYYVIRLIAVAGMLLVLIGIGIKMAISTIASEKALYKRMLTDWVVGFIILFTIHYMMVAIIAINETMVKMIREAANSKGNIATQVTKKEFKEDEKTNEDLEIGIYEAARTRAYDPKLINGVTGMVLYATLVYFAFRFSLMYLKRYLTIIALTLMAPGVGFAYAIQKALSGKSQAFGNWLKEYIMNVIIQVVHALLYSSFVSIALVISLNSISGMIIAFILLNFMLKADKLFRKIFNMSTGGSLLDHTSNAGSPESIEAGLKTAQGIYMGAKPVAKALAHSPLSQAVKGVAKTARNGAILGIAKGKDFIENSDSLPARAIRKTGDGISNTAQKAANGISSMADRKIPVLRALGKAFRRAGLDGSRDEEILRLQQEGDRGKNGSETEEELLKRALIASQKAKEARDKGKTDKDLEAEAKERWDEYHRKKNDNARLNRLEGGTVGGAVKAHLGELFNINNYYRTTVNSKGDEKRVAIGKTKGMHGSLKDLLKNNRFRMGLSKRITKKNWCRRFD